MGGGPSALSCTYYLTIAGYKVTVIAKEAQPGGTLLAQAGTDPKLNQAVMHDLQGVKAIGIGFEGQRSVMEMDMKQVLENYDAIYLPEAGLTPSHDTYNT
jgi:NADPH-dependent glutamate synthase beta subunit-like oxidoreductase